MTPKFPTWIFIVLALQFLLAAAGTAFAVILGSAFSGEIKLEPALIALITAFLAAPILALWLARTQWRTGKMGAAKLFAFAPILASALISVILELFVT